MSRKASKPIQFSNAVKIDRTGDLMTIKGPKGELTVEMKEGIEVKIENNQITVDRKDESQKPFQGLVWSLINNAVIGVTQGFSRSLQVVGKGWRSGVNGDVINLQVGYSHPMDYKLPKGVTATQKNPGEFILHSHDKQLLGQVCAKIKAIRPVEPYKLKGIRIEGQFLRQKVRKAAGV
ncbi:MAG: 50S ribosomal protein L6 [Acidobacteria bacterium]|jgi:large subunit ribosomal protein L6|nr:50S ribosomal protein L6 [Acidobacteriota bacterium]